MKKPLWEPAKELMILLKLLKLCQLMQLLLFSESIQVIAASN